MMSIPCTYLLVVVGRNGDVITKQLGNWQEFKQNILRKEELFVKGEKAYQKVYHENGNPEDISTFHDNELIGMQVFYSNKQSAYSKLSNLNGNLHGPYISYYENGRIEVSGYYEKGHKIGSWKWYDSSGILTKERTYKNLEVTN